MVQESINSRDAYHLSHWLMRSLHGFLPETQKNLMHASLLMVYFLFIFGGGERVVEGGAGGHGEEAGGRPRQARTHGGGETTLALHGEGEPLRSNTCNILYHM
jgi:hypothetical protein